MFKLYDFFCGSNTINECWQVLKEVLKGTNIKYGYYINAYEREAAKVMNTKYAVSFAAGRHALYSILKSLGIGEGDEVILQAFTCVVVPNAIMYTGAKPIYVDIDRETFNADVEEILSKITCRTKAIIVQHTFGRQADIEKIKDILFSAFQLNMKHIYIIEDMAHSVGITKLKGDVGFYSSDHTKMISTSTGGMAFTNDGNIWKFINIFGGKQLSYARILQIIFTFIVEVIITYPRIYYWLWPLHKILNKLRIFYFFRDENKKDKPKNYPMRLSNIQSFIGLSQLKKLDKNLEHRSKNTFDGKPLLRKFIIAPSDNIIPKKSCFIVSKLGESVPGVWFNSSIFGAKDLKQVHYEEGSCPNAEWVSERIINFPTHERVK